MKIENVWTEGDFYFIGRDDGVLVAQRRCARAATDSPMRGDEEIIVALCEKIMADEASYLGATTEEE